MGDFFELNKDFKNQVLTEIDIESDTGYNIYCNIKPISPEVIEKNRFLSTFNIPNEHSESSLVRFQ